MQEFDLKIKERKESESGVADHLSRLVREEDCLPSNGDFLD